VSEEVEAVSVAMGKHLLLPCETGAVNPPTQSTWMKDGVEVTGNEVGINATCVQSFNYVLVWMCITGVGDGTVYNLSRLS
jgi:hypothetical protein